MDILILSCLVAAFTAIAFVVFEFYISHLTTPLPTCLEFLLSLFHKIRCNCSKNMTKINLDEESLIEKEPTSKEENNQKWKEVAKAVSLILRMTLLVTAVIYWSLLFRKAELPPLNFSVA